MAVLDSNPNKYVESIQFESHSRALSPKMVNREDGDYLILACVSIQFGGNVTFTQFKFDETIDQWQSLESKPDPTKT